MVLRPPSYLLVYECLHLRSGTFRFTRKEPPPASLAEFKPYLKTVRYRPQHPPIELMAGSNIRLSLVRGIIFN